MIFVTINILMISQLQYQYKYQKYSISKRQRMLRKILAGSIMRTSSVNKNQMDLFNKLTNWWHPAGPSQILYAYNYHRIEFLRKHVQIKDQRLPLKNLQILDVGCGAGFLSESMARLGGNVTGLDPNLTSYTEATNHKSTKIDLKSLKYQNNSLQQFIQQQNNKNKKFDLVTSMQVIQHVNNPQEFLNTISSCTKEGGLIMLSTIRRSVQTWLTHILLAQKIIGVVPKGTHHHQQFINPEECQRMLQLSGFEPLQILQLDLNWKGEFEKKTNGGNYLIIGRKKNDKIQKSQKNEQLPPTQPK